MAERAGVSLERRPGRVLVGNLLDREDGVANEVEACRLYLYHRLADVVNDERDHEIGVVGDQPDIPMLLRVTSTRSRRCVVRRRNVTVSPSPAASGVTEARRLHSWMRQFAMSPE